MLKRKSHRVREFFSLALALFAAVMIWLLSHNYQSEYSLHVWAKILSFSANEFRMEDFGILSPYLPIYLFWGLTHVPGLHSEYVAYLISVVAAASTFAHWNTFLVKKGYRFKERLLLLMLVISHPFILWGMTSGLNNALTLCVFYLFCFGIVRLVLLRDMHSILFLSISLATFFLVDDRSMYIAIVMFPFIPLIAPERMLKESFPSVFVILLTPFILILLSWIYMNWMFHNDPFMFMHAPEATFNGVWQDSHQYQWLSQWGGEWISSIGHSLWLSLLSAPAIVWMIWRNRKHYRVLHTVPKLFLMPAVAAVIGSVGFALFHAISILYLQMAVFMAALLLLPRLKGISLSVMLALLFLGNVGGWWIMFTAEAPQLNTWKTALSSPVTYSKSDENLAHFIEKQSLTTFIDERAGYRVISAMNNVDNLVFPFKIEVKLSDKYYIDTIEQFATINPSHQDNVIDGVEKMNEGLYWGGLQGFHLVYDDQQWRVYRRDNIRLLTNTKKD